MHNLSLSITKSRVAYVLFILASSLYIAGISPTVYWRDSPEFVTAVHILGTTHPAGAPTYTLLAKFFAFLPIGSVALRVNVFSSLCGALTVTLAFLVLYEMIPAGSKLWRFTAAIGGAVFLLFSESLWLFSEVAEVYTLQECFLLGLLLLLLKAREKVGFLSIPFLWIFAFLYGLSAGVHATMALFIPAFFLLIFATNWRILLGKRFAFLAFFFLLGFLAFLYLPLRSVGEPVLDWGDTETFRQFLIHITDRKDADFHFELPWPKLPGQLRIYGNHLVNEFSFFGITLAFIGFFALFFRDKIVWLSLICIFASNVAFFIRAWTSAFGFLPSFIVVALWIGYGIYTCFVSIQTLYQRYPIRLPSIIVPAMMSGCLILTYGQLFLQHVDTTYQSNNYSAELYGKELMAQLPPDAIFFSEYSWFPLLYLQQVERQRPDFTLLLHSEIFAPAQFAFLSKKRFPYITLVTSEKPVEMSTLEYFWQLCRLNQDTHTFFWDPDNTIQAILAKHLRPQGLLFAFTPSQENELTPEGMQQHKQQLIRSTRRILHNTDDHEAREFLGGKVNQIGLYFRVKGLNDYASEMYLTGMAIQPERFDLHNNYGGVLLEQGRFAEAFEHFSLAYEREPGNFIINKNLGLLFLKLGDDRRAADFLEQALTWGIPEEGLYALLGEAHLRLGEIARAVESFQAALATDARRGEQQDNPLLQGDVYAQLGEAYIQLGRFPEASRALQQAVTSYERRLTLQEMPPSIQTIVQWAYHTLSTLEKGSTSDLMPHPLLKIKESNIVIK